MKRYLLALSLIFSFFSFSGQAMAHCPLCTGAIGIAAVTAKYYGVDTSIIGLFVGAFGVSMGLWIGRWLRKKGWQKVRGQIAWVTLASFLGTVIPLLWLGGDQLYISLLLWGEPGGLLNMVYNFDAMVFGSVVGGLLTLLGLGLHTGVKRRMGRVLFPYQGIAFTLLLLLAAGFWLALLTAPMAGMV